MNKTAVILVILLMIAPAARALQPDEILVIANSDVPASVKLAKYYCQKRAVPADNILILSLGKPAVDKINRTDYENELAEPIRKKLSSKKFAGKIKCLLTTFGVPFKVGPRGMLPSQKEKLNELRILEEEQKKKLRSLKTSDSNTSELLEKSVNRTLAGAESEIDRITGIQTGACVDSELSMVLCGQYELYKWQPNRLKIGNNGKYPRNLMVSRLDGPGENIAMALVDKAIAAEKNGLTGRVYIDSRGIEYNRVEHSFGYYDQSLRDLALLTKFRTEMPVTLEDTEELFAASDCPQTALYCGWYSLEKYINAFDFVDGAIGFHIASFEAVDLRSPASSQWCPAMLTDGITVTLGPVAEPYLSAFPKPKDFFLELFNGRCIVEAFYRTKPFNSWQLVLIGDPLYTPFKKR